MSFIFLHFFILIAMFCLYFLHKIKTPDIYKLTSNQMLILIDDTKRAFVLQKLKLVCNELENSKQIVSNKSLSLLGYMFAVLGGLLYLLVDKKGVILDVDFHYAISLSSFFILFLMICNAILLIMPRAWMPDAPQVDKCFDSLCLDKTDIVNIEIFDIESTQHSIKTNALIHNKRIDYFNRILLSFITITIMPILIQYSFCLLTQFSLDNYCF